MDDHTLAERLTALEGRLARLEARLGAGESNPGPPPPAPASPAPTAPAPAPQSSVPPSQSAPAPASPLPAPPPLPVAWAKPASPDLPRPHREQEPGREQEPEPVAPPPVPPPPAGEGGSLEAQVGVKWVGWAGAILVVIGAALLIKYAYDHQWFGALSPAVRLALMSLGGFALLAAGEVVLRRVGAVAAAGPFGAGVATLFVVSFAGFKYFELYGPNVSFGLMALVTLIGAGVAIRGNLVSIAALSIVGGNVAPAILKGENPALTPLLAYLLMLQMVALALAWWGRGPKWWTLRGLALATICFWMALPVFEIDELPGQRWVVLAFALLYAGLFHAELVLSAIRRPIALTYATGFAVPVPLGARDDAADLRGLGVTFALLDTAVLTAAVLLLLGDQPPAVRGAWTVGVGACCLALGLVLPHLARRPGVTQPSGPGPALAALAIGYRIQAAALLVVAVPVTLSGVWVTIVWAVLGVAFAVAGAMLNLSVSRIAGIVAWLLAVAHLAVWTLAAGMMGGPGGPMAVWAVLFGEPIPAYAVLALALTLIGHCIAALVREDWSRPVVAHYSAAADDAQAGAASQTTDASSQTTDAASHPADAAHNLDYESRASLRPAPVADPAFHSLAALADVGAAGVFLVAAASALPPLGFTLAMLCYGWALLGGDRLTRSPVLAPAGLLLVALAAGKWLLLDTLGGWLATGHAGGRGYRPVYNPAAAVGAALLASAAALRVVSLRPVAWRPPARAAAGFAAVLILLWTATMEINRYFQFTTVPGPAGAVADTTRAKQVAISVFWSVYAIACVAVGFRLRSAGLRYFGLALFAATAIKVMAVDLSEVQTGYRILSFLALGLLLLGTSVLYGKVGPIILRERHV